MKWLCKLVFINGLIIGSASVLAIDNPDAPDLVANLEVRSQQYLVLINNASGYRDSIRAYNAYQEFLETELLHSYEHLIQMLDDEKAQKLAESQELWIKHRDVEFSFVRDNWTVEQFGSSSSISRGSYRCAIIKARLIQLLHYQMNY